jgi:hypothetical protein
MTAAIAARTGDGMAIRNAKNDSFKQIFGDHGMFVSFLKNYVPVDILKDVAPADVEDITPRFLPLFQDSRESDTVKQIKLKGDVPLFVITILEHESEVNYRTSFKLLQYITLVLTDYEKRANEGNKNASAAKGFKYPPVLPIVFYDGAWTWTAETNFLDKTEMSGIFSKYIPKFEYELVDLKQYDERDIIRFGDALSLIMLIDKIQTADGISAMGRLPPDYIENLKQNIPPHLNKLLADVITVLLERINVPRDEIVKVTEQLYERKIQEMFTSLVNDVQENRRIAREEGREKGREEGRIETRAEYEPLLASKDAEIAELRARLEAQQKPSS